MKTLRVTRKVLLEIVREPQMLGLSLLLPLVFLAITASSYSAPLLTTHPVLVIGAEPDSEPLLQELEAERYADDQPAFRITPAEERGAAEAALKNREATILLLIDQPDPQSDQVEPESHETSQITVVGDALSSRFYRASSLLDSFFHRYIERIEGRPATVRIVTRPITPASPETEFDLYAPGMMVFALLMIIPQTAMLVAREVRWKTLRRLQITRLKPWELLGGISLAQLVVAAVQVVIVLASALALGFNNQGSIGLALVVGMAICVSAIGQGLIAACFSENDSQAANVGSTATMLQVFLSGAFYQLPPITLFTLAGHQIDLFDVFPATHGFLALQQVLSYGAGLSEIGFRLGALALLSTVYFAIGVVIFRRLQMEPGR